MYTLRDLLRRAATLNPRGAAIVSADRETISWSQLLDRVRRIAGALVRLGVVRGDRVAIIGPNSARQFELIYAVVWMGAIAVPINTRLSSQEIAHCLEDLDGVWVCADETFTDVVTGISPIVDGMRGSISMREVGAAADAGEPGAAGDEVGVQDTAMIIFTGGTTGASKGVELAHGQILDAAQQTTCGLRSLGSKDVYLHAAPMYHVGDGLMCFVSAVATCANAFLDRFDLPRFVSTCNELGVSWVTLVPTMVRDLCLHLQQTQCTLPSLQACIYGGSPMPEAVLELVMNTLPTVALYQGYGSTEALCITMLGPEHHTLGERGRRHLRSAGLPNSGVLVTIQDADGHELPRSTVGQVCVRSNSIMKGYWRKPLMTREALHGNWLHTGDAGYMDEEGFLYLVDRYKDMIITGGENVYSSEVETVLGTHAAIEECAVVGLPHPKWGESVHAIVRCKAGVAADAQALSRHCRERLASYKVPKSFQFTDVPLARTSMGKLCKARIRQELVAPLPAQTDSFVV